MAHDFQTCLMGQCTQCICGKHSDIERWDELTIQLLDGSSNSSAGHMQARKFASILQKSIERLALDSPMRLVFEFSPNNGPLRKLRLASINVADQSLLVWLGSEKAVCKPFERSKVARVASALSNGVISSGVKSYGVVGGEVISPPELSCCDSSADKSLRGSCC